MVNVIPISFYLDECRWPKCHAEPVETQIPLCERHFQYIGERFVDERTPFGATGLRAIAEQRGREVQASAERYEAREDRRQQALSDQTVVYYVRIGDHVKIGYTCNLKQRLVALRVAEDAVLATEPGARELERRRHLQFADERVGRREDFNPSKRLLAHLDALISEHGKPVITTYPKVG